MSIWLLLSYKLPSEPSAPRVAAWRKLKRLGALLVHDTLWVLPLTPATREQFQWLASEIEEQAGSALVWEAQGLWEAQDEVVVEQFVAQVEEGYQAILGELAVPEPDLAALGRRYQQLQS